MQSIIETLSDSQQVAHSQEKPGQRKVGVEIVRSAELGSRFYRGWRPASYSLRDDLWSRRLSDVMR